MFVGRELGLDEYNDDRISMARNASAVGILFITASIAFVYFDYARFFIMPTLFVGAGLCAVGIVINALVAIEEKRTIRSVKRMFEDDNG